MGTDRISESNQTIKKKENIVDYREKKTTEFIKDNSDGIEVYQCIMDWTSTQYSCNHTHIVA